MGRTEAIDARRLDEFVALPARLHAKDALFVPPLRQAVLGELSGPATRATGGSTAVPVEKQLFLHGDEGRIAALIDPRLPFGQLGYFEAATEEAARSLIAAGLEWLRARGAKQAIGPMNGGAHRLHRFLVEGFERPPFLFEPRNPPEYPRWWEAQGFARIASWSSYEAPRAWFASLRALIEPGVARAARSGHRDDPLEGVGSLPRVHALLDAIWSGHVGYASLSAEEFAAAFTGPLALMSRRTAGLVVDGRGRDVGCAFMYPDWVDEVRALRGDAAGWASWVGTKPPPRRMVMHTVAFRPEARRTGAPFLILDVGLRHLLEDAYEDCIFALVTDEWRVFLRALRATRVYALYGRAL